MPEPLRTVPIKPEPPERLESWKEIAAYLGREVRTVQIWEKNEGLPIHRLQHGKQGSVHAFRSELDAWRAARRGSTDTGAVDEAPRGLISRGTTVWVGVGILIIAVSGVLLWNLRRPTAPTEGLSSIVVLPFLDLSPQNDQEYFSDGLTEEIIDALSRVPNLRVVARTSAFAFKGKAVDIRQIGQQFNVNAVLEGSVRKAGDEIRITAQLNRVSDGTHLWSRTYDRQLKDIFAVQRDISQAIADQLRAGEVPQRAPTTDLEAYRSYQEARYFFNQHLPPVSYNKAIEHYERAIGRDHKFALAYAGMADAYAYLTENFVLHPREAMPKAKEAAEKAVALNDALGEAHISRGIVKLDYEWDRDGAQSEFRRALELNPGSSWARHWYAHSLEARGKPEEALKEMRAALSLDPLSVPIYWDIANELNWLHRYDETIHHIDKGRELFPKQPIFLFMQAWAYYGKGDMASGHRVRELMKSVAAEDGIDKLPMMEAINGWGAALEGRQAEAEQILTDLERRRQKEYVEPMIVTWVCAALHDPKCVLRWFERGYEERSSLFVYAPLNKPVYDGVSGVEALYAKAVR